LYFVFKFVSYKPKGFQSTR